MTITESGYVEDPENSRTAGDDPVVRADAAGDFAAPRSAFGLIVAALRARREAGVPGLHGLVVRQRAEQRHGRQAQRRRDGAPGER